MTVSHMLFQLLIKPLEVLFEVIYGYAMIRLNNPGLAIIVMSLVMNILLLPLYRRADLIQEEERRLEKAMEPGLAHIRQVFHGDERFMMQQTYYRQNHYMPWYTLKGLVPLLLEIPFFLAAYHFLSHLEDLAGASFGPLPDLGAPDHLLSVFGVSVSVMPILMTVINIISSVIYTRGLSRRDKLQLYAMALVFLVLLYDSPSGLVLYWTMNNLFSLVKNIICRLPDSKKVMRISLSAAGVFLFVYAVFFLPNRGGLHKPLLILFSLLLQLPVCMPAMARFFPADEEKKTVFPKENSMRLFFLSGAFLTVLTGLLIPSAVISSSPADFASFSIAPFSLLYLVDSFLLAAGFFLVWLGIFYGLANRRGRYLITMAVWSLSIAAIVNYMFFGTELGVMSNSLVYDQTPVFSRSEKLINLFVSAVLFFTASMILRKNRKTAEVFCAILLIAVTGMSAFNIRNSHQRLSAIKAAVTEAQNKTVDFTLSKDGHNVIVIMLDRAIGCYIPYLFHEKPELEQLYDGFTWYPNTLSLGAHTVYGLPEVFGGYEYSPQESNKRDADRVIDKHNEALRVMPVLFSDAGYEVTVCDPSYAGDEMSSGLSVFEDYPDIHTYLLGQGQFFYTNEDFKKPYISIWERNFFCFSVMKCSPLFLQPYLYQDGTYFCSAITHRAAQGMSYSRSTSWAFIDSYSALQALPDIARVTDDGKDTFLMLCSMITHEPTLLQEPDYTISPVVDNRIYDREHADRFTVNGQTMRMENERQMKHYHINMAALLVLGRWFDTLRAAGCYDNCRIILVSDHGADMNQLDSMRFGEDPNEDAAMYNSLLMVKDFNAHGFTVSEDPMINADTPLLAMKDLIAAPTNPFTGNPIDDRLKQENALFVYTGHQFLLSNDATRCPEAPWYRVQGDLRDGSNWVCAGEW